MDISLVIPLYNEDESLPELHNWIVKVMTDNNFSYEIVFVDDGSTDNSWKVIKELQSKDSNIKAIRFRRNYGKSAGLNVGFEAAQGDFVITMDADLQDSPEEIPEMVKMIKENNLNLVSGWKQKRHDPLTKTIPTKLYNWATRRMSGIELHDFNCGLKAYKKDVIKSIEIYGEMHRYIPVIAKRAGFGKIGEKVVAHQARKYGVTKFGLERFINGFLDLLTISFISKFGKRPMHFFGTLGTLTFILGVGLFTYVGGVKIHALINKLEDAKNIADQSVFYIALVFVILGTQMFLAGFLGEMISRNSPNRNNYQIKERI